MQRTSMLFAAGLFAIVSSSAPMAQPHTLRGIDADSENIIFAFGAGAQGAHPWAGVVADANGALYGTAANGGAAGYGVVFKLTPTASGYSESTIYSFRGGSGDGALPLSGVIVDAGGNVYGTTVAGGTGNVGVAFKLTPVSGGYQETIIHNFAGGATDGAQPLAGLAQSADGTLFGTTENGGAGEYGSVFSLKPSASGYTERILHFFGPEPDGETPQSPVIVGPHGEIFGTTALGGHPTCYLCGTVFELTPGRGGYTERVIYSFGSNPNDGEQPTSGVTHDPFGNLYGTTLEGGECLASPQGCGVVFKLHPEHGTYTETLPHIFADGADGKYPQGGVIVGKDGALYGTVSKAGVKGGCKSLDCGAVFKLTPQRGGYRKSELFAFATQQEGDYPLGALLFGANESLIGTTWQGGGNGNVYELR